MFRQALIDVRVRVASLFGRRALKARAREEMEFHLEMREQQLLQQGISVEDARSQARREFGNSLLHQEATTASWRYSAVTTLLDDVWSDIRYAARWLWSSPGFAIAAIVTIALGVGVNAGIFTVLNGMLFRQAPVPDVQELVSIFQTVESKPEFTFSGMRVFTTSEYYAYRDRSQTLSAIAARSNAPMTTLGGETPQLLLGASVSCNYFDVLRQPAALGRAFLAEDCAAGAGPVVVLGFDLWKSTFAADTGILGRSIELNRHRFTVVGVAAENAYGGPLRGAVVEYFAPISADPLLRASFSRFANDRHQWLSLIGRRAKGVGVDQVRAELAVIAAQIDQQQPGRSTTVTAEESVPMTVPSDQRSGAVGVTAVLMAAFVFVLLIACANVANLLLARGTVRSQEIAIRLALGASRARVVRQLVTESMLISIAAGLLGSLLAVWLFQGFVLRALPALLPSLQLGMAFDLSPDIRVLIFASALTVGAGILFGIAPALQISKPDVHAAIKQDSPGGGRSTRGERLRSMLVCVQVALCMTLMIAAGLLLRGLYVTYTVDPGFQYRDVAYLSLESTFEVYDDEAGREFRRRLIAEVEAVPGVEGVAYTDRQPLGLDRSGLPIRLPGEAETASRAAEMVAVTPAYFAVLDLPIVQGRTFTEAEYSRSETGIAAAVVSEATARNLWPGVSPIGRTLLMGDSTVPVVGVAADVQVNALGNIDPYYVYIPGGSAALLVESRTSFDATAPAIRAVVRGIDPNIVMSVLPLETNLGWWRTLSGVIASLGASLGVLALALASVGIYGVVAYAVRRRHREIGIRMALGAGGRDVLGMILRQTMSPVIVGAVIGVAAAIAVSRVLSSVLFGVSPADPLGLGGAVVLVLAVAFLSGVLAARPATIADPTAALRRQ